MELPNAEAILAMVPGPEMDSLIHTLVLGQEKRGKIPKYSTDHTKAAEIVMHLPLAMGRINPSSATFSEERPFWGGDPDTIVVTADTPAKALCKAALLHLVDKQPKGEPADEAASEG